MCVVEGLVPRGERGSSWFELCISRIVCQDMTACLCASERDACVSECGAGE